MKSPGIVYLLAATLIFSVTNTAHALESESFSQPEEVPYDQLVQELNSKLRHQEKLSFRQQAIDPFEALQIHCSLGFIQSVNSFVINDRTLSRAEDGMQLGVGIDLFSPEWVAEGILKNYGQSIQNGTTVGLREFDLRLSFLKPDSNKNMKIRISNGLGARYLRYENPWLGLNEYQTTPVYNLGFGFLVPLGSHFDLEFEVQGHLSLVSESLDRHGLGFVFRLDNVF